MTSHDFEVDLEALATAVTKLVNCKNAIKPMMLQTIRPTLEWLLILLW